MLRLIRQNRLSKWFSGYGQEAISVGVVGGGRARLAAADAPQPRRVDHARRRAPPAVLPAHGPRGRLHQRPRPDLPLRPAREAHRRHDLAPRRDAAVADGLALASQLRGDGRRSAAFVGDGATREGDFHEALNLAGVWKLPVMFVVENNGYGLSTPTPEAVRRGHRGGGGGLRDAGVRGGRQRPGGRYGNRAKARAARARRRPGAAGDEDVPHARPRGGQRHEVRARGAVRPLAGPRPARPLPPAPPRRGHARRRTGRHRPGLAAEVEEVAEWALTQPESVIDAEAERAALFAPADAARGRLWRGRGDSASSTR